ncbi:NAD(P)/FAD-dependent oxidoreductase [Halovivax limisalsi]|uniref:NAD(P)/FAD-dependent oxidoreductase n=1 Tax=Halovivax limisalsi TaxID=1453760 RepID=UPI001FFC9C4B|nr:NAD(P)/FAD-dependent oxidoreductase [Halovivax limisalsi]
MYDIAIVGGGVAGRSAGIFTARAGLETVILSADESILARNAHLENYPGFPGGVDARTYLELLREQAAEAGCTTVADRIVAVTPRAENPSVTPREDGSPEAGFVLEGENESYAARRVIAASWPDSEYLTPLDVGRRQRGSKHVVQTAETGRTAVDGVYAAGRIADEPHQAIVAAGHGSKVALAAVQDSETAFYHDWVAPAGYFTGRDRDVPPACEEIDDAERRRRDERARERLRDALAEPNDERPTMHPNVDRD